MKRNALLLGLLFFIVSQSTAQKEKPIISEGLTQVHDLFNTSISKKVSCYRIPAIVTAPNGDLVAAIDERVPSCKDLRGSKDINIVIRRSPDHGKSWVSGPEPALIDPGCNGSIIRYTSVEEGYKKNRLLFSNAKMKKGRENMTVRLSYDEGKTWTEGKTIYRGSSAYSSLTILENGEIGLFFEKDNYTENLFVSFSLDWLTDGEDTLTTLSGCNKPAEIKKIEVAGVMNPLISLNGIWKFSMSPPANYWENSVETQNWPDINVPGECQMRPF